MPGFELGTIGARHSFVNHLSPNHGMNSIKAAKKATQNWPFPFKVILQQHDLQLQTCKLWSIGPRMQRRLRLPEFSDFYQSLSWILSITAFLLVYHICHQLNHVKHNRRKATLVAERISTQDAASALTVGTASWRFTVIYGWPKKLHQEFVIVFHLAF